MNVRFAKMSPTQNMTILVESSVPRDSHHRVAQELMRYDGVFAEQVGFIEPPEHALAWGKLQMMGGEFCGNAAMSLAALLAMDLRITPGLRVDIPLEVSGADALTRVGVTLQGIRAECSLEMPLPESIDTCMLPLDGQEYPVVVVACKGITHIIVRAESFTGDMVAFAEKAMEQWQPRFAVDAVGILVYDQGRNHVTPLVCVPASRSCVWERGCGSGTAAIGAWLAKVATATVTEEIAQPGGVLTVTGEYGDTGVRRVTIKGTVRLIARGTAYL